MGVFWVFLPERWDLTDVQAFCNVVVTVTSASFAFVYTRLCWQGGAKAVLEKRSTPLGALLSINTLGEVCDVCRLLRTGILSTSHRRIFSQCVVVSALAIVTFLSGVIVRYSTRWAPKTFQREVPGLLANRIQSGISHETLLWNTTSQALDQAGFPFDRLLDFLPSAAQAWTYAPEDWNSSFLMSCEHTEATSISLAVQKTPCNENTTVNDQIPALEAIYPENAMMGSNRSLTYNNAEGLQSSEDNRWTNVFMFRTGFDFLKVSSTDTWEEMGLTLMFLHMRDVPGTPFSETFCDYSPGVVGFADYTKTFCTYRGY